MPPPAIQMVKQRGWWSRPSLPLSVVSMSPWPKTVRPNSPPQITSVSSRSPRCFRSRTSAADGRWLWKGDTSSDEIDGHFFVAGIYHDLVADEAEKESIRKNLRAIMDHL